MESPSPSSNLDDQDKRADFQFLFSGDYVEELHGFDNLEEVVGGAWTSFVVPSNSARVWTVRI
jgi:maltooligosyltrehalose trehalohydrolase